MAIKKQELMCIIQAVVDATLTGLEERGLLKPAITKVGGAKGKQTAYERTEALLLNYNQFKAMVEDREAEIATIRKHGVLASCGNVLSPTVRGITAKQAVDEGLVEAAIERASNSIYATVQAIALVERGLESLKGDPYYKILEMRYLEGKTQIEMAEYFGCTQQNISYNQTRLVKAMSIRMFPDKVVEECLA